MTPARRPGRRSARYLSIAALCAVAAAGCGSVSSGSSAGPASPPAKAPAPKVSLTIAVTSSSSRPQTSTLRCDPPGGTHSDPAAACKVLLAAKNPFGPPPKTIMCPMIVAGSKKAVITGTYFGKKVNVTMFDGGCWLGRWHEVGQIFN